MLVIDCPTSPVSWFAFISSWAVRGLPESRISVFNPEVLAGVLAYSFGTTLAPAGAHVGDGDGVPAGDVLGDGDGVGVGATEADGDGEAQLPAPATVTL